VTSTLDAAYDTCATITRAQARNFHYGIRLLPADKRAAMCAIYALARRIDDIGDGPLPRDEKLAALDVVRHSLERLDTSRDPVLVALRDAAARYPIPLDAFGQLVEGVEMDVVGKKLDTFDELVHYCRCVAGTIGRLCVGVFGASDMTTAMQLADTLGVALQLTNILRDVREDFLVDRIYLPTEDLQRFSVRLRLDDLGDLDDVDGALSSLVRWSADRARQWYDAGLRLVPLLDRRSAACCLAMAGIYRRLLDEITADPHRIASERVALTGWQKTVVAGRALAGRAS
jgi:15-cis-phytoene synthase